MMKKIFSLMSIVLVSVFAFTACSDDDHGVEKTTEGLAKVKTVRVAESDNEYGLITFNYNGDKVSSIVVEGHYMEDGQMDDYESTTDVEYKDANTVVVTYKVGETQNALWVTYTYTLENGRIVSAKEQKAFADPRIYGFSYTANGMLEKVEQTSGSLTAWVVYAANFATGTKNPNSLQTYGSRANTLTFDSGLENSYAVDLNFVLFYSELDIPEVIVYAAWAGLLPRMSNIVIGIDNDTTITPGRDGDVINKLTVKYTDEDPADSYTEVIEIGY